MAKSSTNLSKSQLDGVESGEFTEVPVDVTSTAPYNYAITTKRVRSLRDARLLYTGEVTRKQYVWNKAGDIVEVDSEDASILLAKKSAKGCCGSSKGGNIFELV